MANFNALSTELKLLILTHINQTPTLDHPADPAHTLPSTNTDLLNLSRVNHDLRTLVAPLLFHTLILRNHPASGSSIALLATSTHARFVKRLEFIGTSILPLYDPQATELRKLQHVTLPASVERVLANLQYFPALEEVGVWFLLKYDSEYGVREYRGDYREFCSMHNTRPTLLDGVYLALARNPPGKVKALGIRNLLPLASPVWQSAEWHAFLGGLNAFTVQFYVTDDGWYCADIADEGYGDFMQQSDRYFWNHLHNTTHLAVAAAPQAFLGQDFAHIERVLLPLSAAVMPKLEALCFDYIFMGGAVVEALRAHAATLRSVRMRHVFVACSNSVDDMEEEGAQMTWAKAFDTLCEAPTPFPQLTDFQVLCTGDWPGMDEELVEEQRAADAERERLLAAHTPELRYGLIDFKYGGVDTEFDVEEHFIEVGMRQEVPDSAQLGRQGDVDRVAYERFMDIVRGNRERLGVE